MRYLLAIVLPPVAVLSCGKLGQAILNLLLWLCGIVPGIIHAILVVGSYQADKRMERMIKASRG